MVAAILALLSLLLLPSTTGVTMAWIFNLWGSVDLLNAFYQANHAGLLAGQLGAAFFLPTLVVPLLLITHGLVFRILLTPGMRGRLQDGRKEHKRLETLVPSFHTSPSPPARQ